MVRQIWWYREALVRFLVPCKTDLSSEGQKGQFDMDIQEGDRLTLKKKHPCGSFDWEVLRIGADFRLKCAGCGHQIMIARKQVEKNVRKICYGGRAAETRTLHSLQSP